MKIIVLVAVGLFNIYFGMRRRSKNLPLAEEYKQNILKKYKINNEVGLRDFEEFCVILLGVILLFIAASMYVMDSFNILESTQMTIFIGIAAVAVYSYRTVRGTFITKRKK